MYLLSSRRGIAAYSRTDTDSRFIFDEGDRINRTVYAGYISYHFRLAVSFLFAFCHHAALAYQLTSAFRFQSVRQNGHDFAVYSAAVQTNASCNPVIILYAEHHFIEQTNFVRLCSSFCRFRNAFCLLKQLDFLQLQLFVTNMGFNNILFAFAVHLDFETKKLRITLTNIDNACFLWGNFQV